VLPEIDTVWVAWRPKTSVRIFCSAAAAEE
jgi:hypothetical protein